MDNPTTEKDEQQNNAADTAIADTLLEFQKKYETEKAAREDAEKKIVELSKVIRTMQVRPQEDSGEKTKTLDDAIKNMFE